MTRVHKVNIIMAWYDYCSMEQGQQPELLNVRETARRLGVHENTVRNWAQRGVLPTARIPGSRFHRFDARDVERLRGQRGSAVSSVERERRTVGPELVDASQLSVWATSGDAPRQFPELVRRLLASTPGLTNISIRAGNGVAAPGWDGLADSSGASFLPAGSLAFEFGVGGRPREKASADYEKRCADSLGLLPGATAFIFATPRRWGDKERWAAERRAESPFADVKVLDADDLEGWLQEVPAVHHWISEQLGRRPRDVETLERWWERFRGQTDPALPVDLFLAGREREQEQLRQFFGERPAAQVVQAPSREEAVAFICATIERLERDHDSIVQPPLLVRSAEVWDRLVLQPGDMTLLPLFPNADLGAAIAGGHHVLLPIGRDEVASGDKIELPRPHRKEAADALEAAGLDSDRSYRLAALARRSMPAVVRELSRDPSRVRPPWAELPHAAVIAPAMLIGSWTASDEDSELVSRMVGKPYDEIERTLLHWYASDDPPFVQSGTQWHLASAEEAFLVLRGALTRSDLARWHQTAVATLLEGDPVLDLAPEERPMAGFKRIGRRYSTVLRRGMAEGIALVGAAEDQRFSDGVSGRAHANRVVGEILRRAASDESARTWHSLADVLTLLAEAAPDAFLEAVHADLDRAQPLLATMFQDGGQSSWLYSSSPHTGLLWALETLCWSRKYLLEAASALARLQEVDPGGRLANRPIGSLSSVLVGWIRHTSAPLEQKARAVERICSQQPAVGWQLLAALWPDHHSTASPPASPHFRDWKPESRSVSIAEWAEYIGHFVSLAIELAGRNPERWGELADRIAPLPPDDRTRLLEALHDFAAHEVLSADDRLLLWEKVHSTVAQHRRFPDADWSMDEEPLSRLQAIADRLEPSNEIERFAYLFDWHPDLPEVQVYDPNATRQDHEEYEARLLELRTRAVAEALRTAGLGGVFRLARRAQVPRQIGWLVGELASDDLTPELLSYLDSEDTPSQEVAFAWAMRKSQERGVPWLREQLEHPECAITERRVALALAAPAGPDVWDLLDELDSDLARLYWLRVGTWGIRAADVERATRELLALRRAWAAVAVLATATHREKSDGPASMTPALVQEVLIAALKEDPRESPGQTGGYEVGRLLDYLEQQGVEQVELARLEFAFFRMLEHRRRPRALFAALSEDPSLFVDLVSLVYRGKDEPRRQPSEDQAARASHAWWVLAHWRELPGRRDDGTVDGEHLRSWVEAARLAFADSNRVDIGDERIGNVLAASPPGADGIWPSEPVRDIIETVGSQDLISGVHIGVINDRGVTTRGVYDGGQQERELAERYRRGADATTDRWQRTSRMLRRLAASYEQEAHEADARAEVIADTE